MTKKLNDILWAEASDYYVMLEDIANDIVDKADQRGYMTPEEIEEYAEINRAIDIEGCKMDKYAKLSESYK